MLPRLEPDLRFPHRHQLRRNGGGGLRLGPARLLQRRGRAGEMGGAAGGWGRLGSFSGAGEPVEWARKLCSANLIYGSRLLIGSYTFQLTETSMEVRPMDFVHRHPNDHGHEEIYELLARKQTLSDEDLLRRDFFWKGILYFREAQWDKAIEHLSLASAG